PQGRSVRRRKDEANVTRPRDFLGPYRLVRLIRVGHTCQVWEAAKTDDPTRYVLKVLRPDLRKNKEEVAALRNEYECAHKLRHKNIIRIYECNVEGDTPYLVMEHFEHENLKLLLRDGPQRVAHLAPKIIEQGAEALFYLHSEGWIHRDVKPDNFLVSDEGMVKLIDFAISVRQKSALAALFSFGKKPVQGTRSYMSPEQIRNQNLDPRADIYSYGCVLFELLSGKPPFTGVNADDLLTKHLSAPIPSVQVYNDNVTPEFSNLIRKMMAKRREERPATMWEFLKEYRSIRPFKVVPKAPPPEALREQRKGFV
ncbi:MAG: serine/threonine protein kinase, partial [Bryobacteraceae bacterium]|nr:serine/threonine protein kinase [Bryobacteraceae bacterium]